MKGGFNTDGNLCGNNTKNVSFANFKCKYYVVSNIVMPTNIKHLSVFTIHTYWANEVKISRDKIGG